MSVIGRREAILATGAAGIGSLFAEKRQERTNSSALRSARLAEGGGRALCCLIERGPDALRRVCSP